MKPVKIITLAPPYLLLQQIQHPQLVFRLLPTEDAEAVNHLSNYAVEVVLSPIFEPTFLLKETGVVVTSILAVVPSLAPTYSPTATYVRLLAKL